jgi:hypothetical protein
MKPNFTSKNKNKRGRQHKWIMWTALMFAAFDLLAPVRFAQIMPVQRQSNVPGVTAMTGSPALAENEFCWRDSYGRGVGEVPGRVADCPASYTNNGATCGRGADTIGAPSKVAECPAGYTNMGLTCYRGPSTYSKGCTTIFKKYPCSEGYTDNGCFCGRGASSLGASSMECPAGYHQSDITKRCIKNCPAGYTNTGETCFLPVSTLGMDSMTCKPGEKRVGARCYPTEGACGAGMESDAGLCYPKCRAGYAGVGPVCWGQPPPGWVQCGMGAAKDSTTCASIVFGQVTSVGQLALTVASLGSSTALTAGMSAPEKASRFAKLRQQYSALKVEFELLKKSNQNVQEAADAYKAANALKKGYKAMGTAEDAVTEEDMIRLAAQIAAIVDTTGISDTVASYTYPKCSKYGYSPNFVGQFEMACRAANNGGDPKETEAQKDSNMYFDLYKYQNENGARSLAACQAACKDGCTGVEYNDSNGRCELWKVPITDVSPSSGYACYRKRP